MQITSISLNGKKLWQKIATWSLPARLLLFYTLFSLFTWSIVSAIAWQGGEKHTKQFFNTQMILFAKTLGELDLSHLSGKIDELDDIISHKKQEIRFGEAKDTLSFAVFSHEGQLVLSDDDDGNEFPFIQKKGFTKAEIDDDDWQLYMTPSDDGKKIIVVGQEREYREKTVLRVIMRHLTPWLIILPLFLLGLGWILYYEFRPLRRLAAQLQKREAQDTQLLDESSLTPETRPLIQSLNVLFTRISSLLTKERAFVSNAAHELRTPLAGLRIQAEVMEMSKDDEKARDHAVQKILQGTMRCTHLVEQLLLLSNLEAATPSSKKLSPETMLCHNLLEMALEEAQEAAQNKGITLSNLSLNTSYKTSKEDIYQAQEMHDVWSIVLRNLLDNAIRYTPHGGKIFVKLSHDSLQVENTAPHLENAILAQLGQRFYRPPGQKEQGSGLGLAIVRHIASLHDAQLLVENSIVDGEQGLRVSIIFHP